MIHRIIAGIIGIGLVEIFLNVGVPIPVSIQIAIGGVIGVKSVRRFPFIGHAILVGVCGCNTGIKIGLTANLHGIINDASGTIYHLLHDTRVHGITHGACGSSIGQHRFVCLLCAHCGNRWG